MPTLNLNDDREHKYTALIEEARVNAQTDWEEEFVADIVKRTKRNPDYELSDAQLEKLDQIASEDR